MYQRERSKHDPLIGCGCFLNCPRMHVVSGFEAIFAKKSCLGQCIRGFVGFLGKILKKKIPAQFVFGFGVLEPRPHWAQNRGCSDMLSRLKGIETPFATVQLMPRGLRSDMLSRLKGIETPSSLSLRKRVSSSDMLSRLKGIET